MKKVLIPPKLDGVAREIARNVSRKDLEGHPRNHEREERPGSDPTAEAEPERGSRHGL